MTSGLRCHLCNNSLRLAIDDNKRDFLAVRSCFLSISFCVLTPLKFSNMNVIQTLECRGSR